MSCRKHKDGKISYYKYVLECKLVASNIVISLDSEFIENDSMLTDKQKQDCETKAFKRMIKRIKKNYPKYKFIITGDALYATTPIINMCKKYHWLYLFNLKPDRLKFINECFEGNIKLLNEVSIPNYYLSTNIAFNKNLVNVIKFIEKKQKKETTFRYITNLDVNDTNIKEIVRLGRNRWKIENNGFYMQKHGTFNITHLNSRNSLHSQLTSFLSNFHGVSTKHLQQYLDWFVFSKYQTYHVEYLNQVSNFEKNTITISTSIKYDNVFNNYSIFDFSKVYSDYMYPSNSLT